MLCNLKAEMARNNISSLDLAKAAGKTERCIRDKLNGKTQFSIPEAVSVRDKFFPGFSLEYLFTQANEFDRR